MTTSTTSLGAQAAGAVSVAVLTGPAPRPSCAAAGADVVLDDLTAFPAWLDEHLLGPPGGARGASCASSAVVLVAFSGGADSAFLLAAAVRALGADQVVAATAISDSLPASRARPGARSSPSPRRAASSRPQTHEMDREGYRANAGDRCYFCKAELLDVLGPLADELGIAAVATGTNADDAVAGFRPGIRAAAERGAVTPLLDAGLTKAQIREASRRWGLPTWDKPAAACLSSRVAYGIEITPARLARVERAEAAVRAVLADAGIAGPRPAGPRPRRPGPDRGRRATARRRRRRHTPDAASPRSDAGFDAVEVDPRGFRSGSMNELLADRSRYR